jgi:hypothetical protein
LDYLPTKSSDTIEVLKSSYRKVVPSLQGDRIWSDDIKETIRWAVADSCRRQRRP